MNIENAGPVSGAAWWEEEPLLMYEVCPYTLPGISPGVNWQATTDPSVEVDVVKASGALQTHGLSFIEAHLTNQTCYFESAHFKQQPFDYLAAYLEKSRAAGYRTIVYFNVHAIKPVFGDEHPEWKQIRFDRSTIDDLYGIETAFCVNSPWRDWVRGVCLDLCKYPIDGIFFDGPCLFANACYCDNCRRLYREQHGSEMPPKEAGHPELRRLAGFQSESMRKFFEHCNTAIKAVRPDVSLCGNSGSKEEPYYVVGRNNRVLIQAQDILSAEGGFVYGKLYQTPVWRVGANAKYYQTQAGGKPTMVGNSPAHGPWRSYYQTDTELQLAMVQAPLHGSGVWFSGFTWFTDQPGFRKLAELYRFFSANRDVYYGTRSKARIAIVWPEDSINYYGKPRVFHGDFTQGGEAGETVGDIYEEFNGFYDALVKNHLPCDIIDEESVREEYISDYDLLILPNVGCTGEAFDDRLREYVRQGGNVIASFETSICDEDGRRRSDLSLSDLFGVRMLRTPLKPYPHFYFYNQPTNEACFADIHPILLPSPQINTEVELTTASMISPYSVKFVGWDGSEIRPSEYPAITSNQFGRGKAVYLAGTFGEQYWNYQQMDIRLLLRNLYFTLSRRDVALENAPQTVEVVHRHTKDDAVEIVSLINHTGIGARPFESIQSLGGISLRVRTNKKSARALRLGEGVEFRRESEWLRVYLPGLDIFETLILE